MSKISTAAASGRTTTADVDWLARYRQVRTWSEALAQPLSPEDCMLQSMADASPTRWHLAHTTWFFETFILAEAVSDYEPYHPAFSYLFNSYYNTVGKQHPRPQRGLVSRPSLEEVYAYRRHVDQAIEKLLNRGTPLNAKLAATLETGLHHEQQHQELILTDIKHALWHNPLLPAYDVPGDLGGEPPRRRDDTVVEDNTPPLGWIAYEAGERLFGHDGAGFSYDNERPRHRQHVAAFELADRLVTCGEYLEFIEDDGYRCHEFWLSDGWQMVEDEGWQAPLYWLNRDGRRLVFTLSGLKHLDPSEPVTHVSYYEADAFARWAGYRLPTEYEWETAATDLPIAGHFADAGGFHPLPLFVDESDGASATKAQPQQLYGDVWHWTSSPYAGYPGYRPPSGALGEYNGKFMCNQIVLRGGSCATPKSHIRPTYRNFFYPTARWQFSGVRLAR